MQKRLLYFEILSSLIILVNRPSFASTNYYYSNGQKISIEEVRDKKVYRFNTNKEKTIKLKSSDLKQVLPKSYYYKLDKPIEDKSFLEKYFRLFDNKLIELPIYKESITGEELIITDEYLASFRKDLTDEQIQLS